MLYVGKNMMLSPEAAGINGFLVCVIEWGKITIKSWSISFDYGVLARLGLIFSVNIQFASVLNSANKVNLRQTIITAFKRVKYVKIIIIKIAPYHPLAKIINEAYWAFKIIIIIVTMCSKMTKRFYGKTFYCSKPDDFSPPDDKFSNQWSKSS